MSTQDEIRRPIRLDGEPHEVRRITTPDGVPLPFAIAPMGSRTAAFMLDMLILLGGLVAVYILLGFMSWGLLFTGSVALPVGIITSFLGWNFYFTWFELRWRGATPGKRKLGLRVIDAHGGRLSGEAVVVRNLTRDLELYIPLLSLVMANQAWAGAPPALRLVAPLWLIIFALLPFFNRNRQRIGDLLGGTLVVLLPRRQLLSDLVATPAASSAAAEPALAFTERQLSTYGIYELQVLEEVLRMPWSETVTEMRSQVAERIREKIGWEGPPVQDRIFLNAFYAALRAHLERRMVRGKRRESKRSAPP
jgi:uncharacterized RDD family membrane protein YckC